MEVATSVDRWSAPLGALRQARSAREQLRALDAAVGLGIGLDERRGGAGCTLLEACAESRAQEAFLALLDMGADPFVAPRSRDASGRLARRPAFESALALGLPEAARASLARLSRAQALALAERWRALTRSAHAMARLCGEGGTWLHLCALSGSAPCMELCLRAGLDPRQTDDAGVAALALCSKSPACADALLLAGADPDAQDAFGRAACEALAPGWRESASRAMGRSIGAAIGPSAPSAPRRKARSL